MSLEATLPHSDVNVPGDYFSLAGFEVTTYGRFWVTPEVQEKPKEWGYPAGRLWGKGQYPYGDEPKDAKQIEAGLNYYVRKFIRKDCQ